MPSTNYLKWFKEIIQKFHYPYFPVKNAINYLYSWFIKKLIKKSLDRYDIRDISLFEKTQEMVYLHIDEIKRTYLYTKEGIFVSHDVVVKYIVIYDFKHIYFCLFDDFNICYAAYKKSKRFYFIFEILIMKSGKV